MTDTDKSGRRESEALVVTRQRNDILIDLKEVEDEFTARCRWFNIFQRRDPWVQNVIDTINFGAKAHISLLEGTHSLRQLLIRGDQLVDCLLECFQSCLVVFTGALILLLFRLAMRAVPVRQFWVVLRRSVSSVRGMRGMSVSRLGRWLPGRPVVWSVGRPVVPPGLMSWWPMDLMATMVVAA